MLQLYAYIKEKYTKVLSMQSKWNQRLEFYPDTGYFQFFLSKFNKLLNLKFSSYLYLLNINLEMKDLNFEMGSNWNGVGTSKNGFGFYHRVLLLLLALISNGDVSLTIRLFEQTIEKWYTTLPTVLFQVFSSSKAEVFGCAFVSQSLLAHKYSIEKYR